MEKTTSLTEFLLLLWIRWIVWRLLNLSERVARVIVDYRSLSFCDIRRVKALLLFNPMRRTFSIVLVQFNTNTVGLKIQNDNSWLPFQSPGQCILRFNSRQWFIMLVTKTRKWAKSVCHLTVERMISLLRNYRSSQGKLAKWKIHLSWREWYAEGWKIAIISRLLSGHGEKCSTSRLFDHQLSATLSLAIALLCVWFWISSARVASNFSRYFARPFRRFVRRSELSRGILLRL